MTDSIKIFYEMGEIYDELTRAQSFFDHEKKRLHDEYVEMGVVYQEATEEELFITNLLCVIAQKEHTIQTAHDHTKTNVDISDLISDLQEEKDKLRGVLIDHYGDIPNFLRLVLIPTHEPT